MHFRCLFLKSSKAFSVSLKKQHKNNTFGENGKVFMFLGIFSTFLESFSQKNSIIDVRLSYKYTTYLFYLHFI